MTEDLEQPLERSGRWRRRPRAAFIAGGLSLLTLGAIVNFSALDAAADKVARAVVRRTPLPEPEPAMLTAKHKREESRPTMARRFAVEGPRDAVGEGSMGVGTIGLVGTGRGGGGMGSGAKFAAPAQGEARHAGVLGKMAASSGHFLASPHGAAYAVGGDDDVWGGLSGELAPDVVTGSLLLAAEHPLSTFSIDVDTASYTRLRGAAWQQGVPLPEIRIEEMINYFTYEYPQPTADVPFSVTSEVGPCPWNDAHQLVHIGVQGKTDEAIQSPKNLVFLIDTSGSMSGAGGLDLVQSSLTALTRRLTERDRVSIVAYAGAAGVVLPPTPGDSHRAILDAIARLQSGGGTNGSAGIELAYEMTAEHFVDGGVNRVMLATDGDFNRGVSNHEALVDLIEAKRKTGVFLSVLGFRAGGADQMMEQLADHGNGNYAFIDSHAEARKVLVREASGTLVAIAKDVKLQLEIDPDQVEEYRLLGYNNRRLADADFENDRKDAGDLGAGHTVTALYEVQRVADAPTGSPMRVKLRYKQPDGDTSRLIAHNVQSSASSSLPQTSTNFQWSAAVAAFGMKLSDDPAVGESSWARIFELAAGSRGDDRYRDRCGMLGLVKWAAAHDGAEVDPDGLATACAAAVVQPPERVAASEYKPDVPVLGAEHGPSTGDQIRETLRLLPPLLALPMFVMAFRRRRE